MTPKTEAGARELLPCPMCGKTEHLTTRDCSHQRSMAWVQKYSASCDNCCLDLFAPTYGEAVSRWNTRTQPAATGNAVREYVVQIQALPIDEHHWIDAVEAGTLEGAKKLQPSWGYGGHATRIIERTITERVID